LVLVNKFSVNFFTFIVFWLHEFKKVDIKDMGYKRHLIDMLVNSVVVADETNGDQKIIIAYNLSQEASEYRLAVFSLNRFWTRGDSVLVEYS